MDELEPTLNYTEQLLDDLAPLTPIFNKSLAVAINTGTDKQKPALHRVLRDSVSTVGTIPKSNSDWLPHMDGSMFYLPSLRRQTLIRLRPTVLSSSMFSLLKDDRILTFFYANLYGAGLPKIAATLGWSVDKTTPIFNRFRASIPGITSIATQVNNTMGHQKYISYWDGRRRHIRNKADSYKAWNSVIQGGAAQLVKKAILRCDEFADDDCFPVLTVHDEITFCVRTEAIPDYEPKIIKAMTEFKNPDGTDMFPVKFAVEGKEWK